MSEEETKNLLREHFKAAVDPPAVMNGCLSLCKTFNYAGDELFFQWEAYSYGLGGQDKRLTEARLQPFRDHLQRNLQRDSTVHKKRATDGAGIGTPAKALTAKSALASRMLAGASGSTPRREVAVKMEDSPSTQRAGPSAGVSTTRNRVVPLERTNGFTYRYLQDKLLQKGETLNRRIDEFGSYVKEYYGLDELADPNVATEDDVYIVGRICDDSESKLTESSLLLEPSKVVGDGKRLPIRFAPTGFQFHAPPPQGSIAAARAGIGLFPGAIAAFKGITAHGQEGAFFMVKEVLPLPPLKPLKPKVPPPLSFTTVVVCGPYTYDSDLEYQPVAALMRAVAQIKPQALVLMGPFVDSNHPIIQKADLEMTVDDLFLRKIAVPLRNYITTQQPDLSVAFMPGVRDLVSFHNVYPQSPVMGPENFRSWKPPQGTPPWSFISNPGIFSIHGLTFGATSVDVLFHLRRQEVFKALPGEVQQDPMAGLCRHILDQRSFYPVYPVPLDNSQDLNLDVSHSHLLSIPNDSIPDVIFLPSRLKEFSKIVDGTVFVNPSSATKFNNPGMLAKVTVNAMFEGTERISVDLVKM